MLAIHCWRLIVSLVVIPCLLFGPRAVAQPWLGHTSDANLGEGSDIRILTDGEGTWIAVWHTPALGAGTDYDILMSRSVDNGVSWSPAAPLNNNAAADVGDDRIPDLAFDGHGTWHAIWHSNDSLGGLLGDDFDILIAHSSDAGESWTDPAPLNADAFVDPYDDYRPHVATDGKGNCVAVWGDQQPDSIGVSRSADYGGTWMPPITLRAFTTHAIRGEVITDGLGTWMIVWYANWGNNDLDAFVARSVDNGASWSVPTALNINAIEDDGNDFVPQIATDRQGTWVAVWHSFATLGGTIGNDNDILFARSLDNGVTWTFPEPLSEAAADGYAGDHEPHIATDETGNWVVVWSSEALGNPFKVLISRSTDGARTWTSPEVLYEAGDPSYTPRLGTDRKGNWVAAWQVGLPDGGRYSEVLLNRFSMPLCDLIGDVNCDGTVTPLDFVSGGGCEHGPGAINRGVECGRLDFDKDGDLDILDFAGFQRTCNSP